MPLSFDDPKPPLDKRKQLQIFLRPTIKDRIDALRGELSRSAWIEKAVLAYLDKKE